MRRTDVLQGMRLMKFEEVPGRTKRRQVSQEEAASMPGVMPRPRQGGRSERMFGTLQSMPRTPIRGQVA